VKGIPTRDVELDAVLVRLELPRLPVEIGDSSMRVQGSIAIGSSVTIPM